MSDSNGSEKPILSEGSAIEAWRSGPTASRLGSTAEGETFDDALIRRKREELAIFKAAKVLADKYGIDPINAREILVSGE